MLRTIAAFGALASVFAATSANAAWVVSGKLVEARITGCTATFGNACDLTSPNFPASIQGRLVEFVNASCFFSATGAVPGVRLTLNGSGRYQELQAASEAGTNGRSYNSQAAFTIQAATTKSMTLTLYNPAGVTVTANCLLVGRLVD